MGFVLTILFGIRAYAAEATLTIGNNKNSLTNYESVKGGKAGAALFFDTAYMSAYKGCRLTEVKDGTNLCIGYTINDAKNVCYGNALVHNREYILT